MPRLPHAHLALCDVDYRRGSYLLFNKLNLHFDSGHIIAIIGENGCGKSTLLQIIAGILQPHAGSVLFAEHALYQDIHIKQHIGFIPSAPFLYPYLTVAENLKFIALLKQMPPLHAISQCASLLTQWGLCPYQHVLFGHLSDGLKKRVAIVSQLLFAPSLLVLDEPCSALDPKQRAHLWHHLQNYRHSTRLIVLSSHHPDEITSFCDEVYLLQQGKLHLQIREGTTLAKSPQREYLLQNEEVTP